MSQALRHWAVLLIVIGAVVAIDQVSKGWIVNNLMLYETRHLDGLSPFIRLTRSYNTGAAFGIFEQAGDVFLLLSVVIVGALLWFYPRIPAGMWWVRVALALICGGALGNAIDRLTYGHVVDFVHITIPNLISNVSNFADHAIVLGVLMLIYDSWRGTPQTQPPADDNTPQEDAPTS